MATQTVSPVIELERVTSSYMCALLQLVTQWILVDGVHRQFEAFREGFETLFPLSTLRLFYPDEVRMYLT